MRALRGGPAGGDGMLMLLVGLGLCAVSLLVAWFLSVITHDNVQ